LTGTHSSRRINALARPMRAARYLEIGVSKGLTFLAVEIADKTGVDPKFAFDWQAHRSDDVRFHVGDSDGYFAQCTEKFDVVFLDGLHVFEQTFRDLCNALMVTHDRSLIVIDDTVPSDVYSSWPHPREAHALRKQAGGKGLAWHGDVFKVVYVLHDFFPMLSYCTINTGGNPQTLVWREARADFQSRFNSLETISRMTWFHMRRNMALMNLVPEEDALARVGAKLAA
jgi:hypothetical protein